ncbi:MAG: AMP-binding protein [Gammaproteobacteria bacterium]|jgi:1-acyl-sn-glycerol-3-phosphate acyltransferase
MATEGQKTTEFQHSHQIADDLLVVARQLAKESNSPHVQVADITLNSDITNDLGFDSLARVELFDRLEKTTGVSLDETLFAEAIKLKDLIPALEKGGAAGSPLQRDSQRAVTEARDSVSTPESAKTLVDVIHWYVDRNPQQPQIQFYADDMSGETVPNAQLLEQAQAIAAGLQYLGVGPQQPVAIMLPTCKEYFYCFLGILLTGGIPVPLYPPARPSQIEDHVRRHTSILQNCGASVLITVKEAKLIARLLKSHVEPMKHVVTVDDVRGDPGAYQRVTNHPDDIAFLQYTSGSTGSPKGVMLTHNNLLANIRSMGETINASSKDVFVSWLPLYHDMGLIGAWLGSQYYGAKLVVMSPLAFLAKPQRWLWAIHQYGGTLSAAPNFGYEFCLRRISDDQLQGLDLSQWRAAFNGAEAVSSETMEQFYQKYRRYKLRREAVMPVYGLAENSVGLTFTPMDRGFRVDRVQRQTLMESGKAVPANADDETAIQFVSCGKPILNHQVRVVDDDNRELPPRHQGRLQFRGPSATQGYYRNPEISKDLFCDDWLNTGDLAYIADGEVYVTGRTKDMIIRGGRNIYPPEVEEVVGNVEGIRSGRVAVFGSKDPRSGTEQLVVLAETREKHQSALTRLRSAINEQVNDLVGLPPDNVVLAPPGTVLKTSSGKIRRAASKSLYESGAVGKGQRAVWWQFIRLVAMSTRSQILQWRHRAAEVAYGLWARTVFWVLAPMTWMFVVLLPRPAWRWASMRGATRLLAWATATPFTVEGTENLLPPDQPCIYISNHASYLDGPCVVALLKRRFSFIAKAELSHQFVPGLFLKRIDTKFVERFDLQKSVDDAQQFLQTVQQGKSMYFFPEGTFLRDDGILPFHMGAFVTAAQAGVPVVPVAIQGTRHVFRAYDWLPHHGAVHVVVGKPIYPEAADGKHDTWPVAVKLRDQAREQILAHVEEPDITARYTSPVSS